MLGDPPIKRPTIPTIEMEAIILRQLKQSMSSYLSTEMPYRAGPGPQLNAKSINFKMGNHCPLCFTVLERGSGGGLNKPSYLNDDNYDKDDGDKYIDNDDNADMVRKSKLPVSAVRQKPAQDETSGHLQNS